MQSRYFHTKFLIFWVFKAPKAGWFIDFSKYLVVHISFEVAEFALASSECDSFVRPHWLVKFAMKMLKKRDPGQL